MVKRKKGETLEIITDTLHQSEVDVNLVIKDIFAHDETAIFTEPLRKFLTEQVKLFFNESSANVDANKLLIDIKIDEYEFKEQSAS